MNFIGEQDTGSKQITTKTAKIVIDEITKPVKLFLNCYAKTILLIITQYDKMGTFVKIFKIKKRLSQTIQKAFLI